jgi:hypothetical protein
VADCPIPIIEDQLSVTDSRIPIIGGQLRTIRVGEEVAA